MFSYLTSIFSKKFNIILVVLAILYIFLYFFRIESIPNIVFDEALYAFTSLNFSTHYMFDHNFSIYSGKEFCVYPLFLSLFFTLFGPSLFVGRLFSLILGLGSFFIFSFIIRRRHLSLKFQIIILSIFIFFNTNIVAFRLIRPESLLIFFACLCLYCFDRYCSNTFTKKHIIGLGFSLSGLMGTHLIGAYFGVLFGLVFLITLFQKKQYPLFAYFCIGFLPLSLFFTLNLITLFSARVLTQSLQSVQIMNKIFPSFSNFLYQFNTFFLENYVLGIKRLFIVIFECAILVVAIFFKRTRFSLTVASSALLLLIYGLFSLHNFLRPYFVLFPIVSIVLFADFIPKFSQRFYNIFLLCIILLFSNHMAGNAYIFYKNWSNIPFKQLKNDILSLDIAPSDLHGEKLFWFLAPKLSWQQPIHSQVPYFITRDQSSPLSGLTHSSGVYSKTTRLSSSFNHLPFKLIYSKNYYPYGIISIYKNQNIQHDTN